MPNWTYNDVLFVGNKKQLKTLKIMLKSDDNDFEYDDSGLSYRFNTAWDAPRRIAEALLTMQKTILKGISIEWNCTHEDGNEEETIIDMELEYDIPQN